MRVRYSCLRSQFLRLLTLFLIISCAASAAFSQVVPLAQHVVLVIDENTSFGTAFPNGMPWLSSQAKQYGYANNYNSDHSGSLLDYLYLASGSCESSYQCGGAPQCTLPSTSHNFYCNGNDCYMAANCENTVTKDPITDENIFQLMDNEPLSWKVYAQNYLNAGGNVNVPDFSEYGQPSETHYYARHNAAVWYAEVLNNTLGSQGNIVDFEQFGIDVANNTLPRFAIIVPDGCWDNHDDCFSNSLAQADNFLNSNLTPMLALPDFQPGGSGLLLVTFDNGADDDAGQVFTAVIGPNVSRGHISNVAYKHENTLRTMLDSLGIQSYPGWSASVPDMSDFFPSSAGSVVINTPANNSTEGTSVLVNAAASELGAQIDHIEIWDTFNGKATKLGNVFTKSFSQAFTVGGVGQHSMTVQDIGVGPKYAVLHKETTNYMVSSNYGVFVNTPASGSTQSGLVPVGVFAVEGGSPESSSGIDHIEVWNGTTKLGDSPKGSTLNQWYSLTPGPYTLTIHDVTASGETLHTANVSFTVSSGLGVFVNSPANNSTWNTTTIPISAYAYEQNGSNTPLVDHIEVWDKTHGMKLGQSPTGLGLNSNFINQNVTLPGPGSYQLAIEDINPNNGYKAIHVADVNVTVK